MTTGGSSITEFTTGATCAPAYANLFMGYWERQIFQEEEWDSHAIQGWSRYIDDILFIWDDSVNKLPLAMTKLNQNACNIKLTYNFGKKVEFLDLDIRVLEDGRIVTNVFRKPTATNTLLHASSAHHRSTINGIPTGQFLRIKRICTTVDDYDNQALDLARRFSDRGYSNRLRKAANVSRDELLYGNSKKNEVKKAKNEVRFITRFNKQWPELSRIMQKHWSILQSDPILKTILPDRPLMVPRRSRNLKDLLVHSHYSTTSSKSGTVGGNGFFPYNINDIVNDIVMCDGTFTCTSKGVIYHAHCPCGKVYIGLTTRELRVRTREHVRDIEKSVTVTDPSILKTLSRHFKLHHQSDPRGLKIQAIDQIQLGNRA
ncbi:unnamed protein product [Ranitomeya imitator]|uniref:Helix-turn-helix domain-containing protein n=1 Tax=Ranitomeya imitator TaxID=111125 RepID=A0ABN9LVC2_9NEOB|nr:unnamed protein product [Ranitomeya imitator]